MTLQDANGNPVELGLITTYIAGTTTLAPTYSDVGLTTANSNPIQADSSGRYVAFLSPGASYKFKFTTAAGVTVAPERDNISAVPASTSNFDIAALAGEALAAGKGVYLSDGSGGKTAGSWYLTDADNTYSSVLPQVGMTTAAIASGSTGTIRLGGVVPGLTGLVTGSTYYVSATAGAITTTAPANARTVGTADSTTSIVLFPALPSADAGTPVPYTPSWTNTGTANTLGNGTITGDYTIRGKVCFFRIALTFGSTTTSGNGNWLFTVPFSMDSSSSQSSALNVQVYAGDSSTGSFYAGGSLRNTATTLLPATSASPIVAFTVNVPFIWAVSDFVLVSGYCVLA